MEKPVSSSRLSTKTRKVNKVQKSSVSDKRDRKASGSTKQRWLFSGILLLLAIAVGGFFLGRSSLFPFLSRTFLQEQPQPAPEVATTPAVESNQAKIAELESQVKGYELVLQRKPDDRNALTGLIETRLELARLGVGSIKDTIEPLEKLAKQNPQETKYGILLAQTKQQIGDIEGSATAYRSILESKPGEISALDGLVGLLLEEQRPQAAIGLLQDTLENAPKLNQIKPGTIDEVSVRLILGAIYAQQQRYPEAIGIYDKAIKSSRDDFRPILAKAIVLQKQGKNNDAKPLFDAAAQISPSQYRDQIKELASASTSSEDEASLKSSPNAKTTQPKESPNSNLDPEKPDQ